MHLTHTETTVLMNCELHLHDVVHRQKISHNKIRLLCYLNVIRRQKVVKKSGVVDHVEWHSHQLMVCRVDCGREAIRYVYALWGEKNVRVYLCHSDMGLRVCCGIWD